MHPDVPCKKSKVMSPDIQGLHYTSQGKEQLRNRLQIKPTWDWAVLIQTSSKSGTDPHTWQVTTLLQLYEHKSCGSHSCTAVEAGGRSYRRTGSLQWLERNQLNDIEHIETTFDSVPGIWFQPLQWARRPIAPPLMCSNSEGQHSRPCLSLAHTHTHTVMSQNSRFNAQVRINLQHKRVDWMALRTVSTPSLCAEWESSMSEISKRTKEILLYCQ